jgi:hypothetical protein
MALLSASTISSAPARSSNGSRIGVLFVHGVGRAAHGDTLIDFGQSFVGWVARWQWAQNRQPDYRRTELNFTPYDPGSDNPIPYAELNIPRDTNTGRESTWVCSEAWFASSFRPMPFTTMLVWSVRYLFTLIAQLISYTGHSFTRLSAANVSVHDGGLGYRVVDVLTSAVLTLVYLVLGLAGYALLLPIIVVAQIPYEPLQQFVVIRFFQMFLQYNASELRVYIEDEIQAANMRRRVAEAVGWLTKPAADGGGDCGSVTIVAHSGGGWVVHGMLTDETYEWAHRRVRKLITFGCGLNKIWQLAPASLERLYKPLKGNIYWLDFWGSYDPVPAGWLQPRVGEPGLNPLQKDQRPWHCIYEPDAELAERHGLVRRADPKPPLLRADASTARRGSTSSPSAGQSEHYWPDSVRVVNRLDALTDHGCYFTNDEEVLRRVASEIQADLYQDSMFWRGHEETLKEAIPRRRDRVAYLGAARLLAVVVGVIAAGLWAGALANYLVGIGPIAFVVGGASEVQRILANVPWAGPAIAAGWAQLTAWAVWALGAAVASLTGLIPFEVFRALWEAHDSSERDALLHATPLVVR